MIKIIEEIDGYILAQDYDTLYILPEDEYSNLPARQRVLMPREWQAFLDTDTTHTIEYVGIDYTCRTTIDTGGAPLEMQFTLDDRVDTHTHDEIRKKYNFVNFGTTELTDSADSDADSNNTESTDSDPVNLAQFDDVYYIGRDLNAVFHDGYVYVHRGASIYRSDHQMSAGQRHTLMTCPLTYNFEDLYDTILQYEDAGGEIVFHGFLCDTPDEIDDVVRRAYRHGKKIEYVSRQE